MEGYELTERGKVVIAIVLVLLLLLIPSAILTLKAMANQPAQPAASDKSPEASEALHPPLIVITPPIITESPPPNGGGFSPMDVLPTDVFPPDLLPPGGNAAAETPGSAMPPQSSHPSVNPTDGTLSFSFSPTQQDALDSETLSVLDVFLSSPKNTRDSAIIVEMPALSSGLTDRFMSAVISAFAEHGVAEQRLAFATVSSSAPDEPFIVNIYFFRQSVK